MIYPDNFETRIGFDTVRHEVERRCVSTMGVACCRAMSFSADVAVVQRLLGQTAEFMAIVQGRREFPVSYYFDLTEVLHGVQAPGTFMTAEQLFSLYRLLTTVGEIVAFFSSDDAVDKQPYPLLSSLIQTLSPMPDVVHAIATVLDRNGVVRDTASPQLAQLRRDVASLQGSLAGTMRRIIARGKADGSLAADVQPGIRDGRLVLPVAPSQKRRVRGIVHDESASGKTVFIEPEEIVETNNRIRETEAEIEREIVRILTAVTDSLRSHIPNLLDTLDVLGVLDFTRAKALFAIDVDAQMPHITDEPTIQWFNAVHPALLLSLREQGKNVVPMSLELNDHQRLLLISGPNAGGKSVCLKTVGVVQYMAQCGVMPTLRDHSHMGVFESIFIDIGDQQSIEDDLSTYSSHLRNMKIMLNHADRRSLVLIDEFGSGTEPQIGGAIAQAILAHMHGQGVKGVITTHYQNLKQYADHAEGIVNGAMLYDRQRMTPLFQLSVGYPGSSFAIEIARNTGLPDDVIDMATDIVGSDYINTDKFLLDIVRDRRYWENKRHDIRQKEKRLDEMVADYEQLLARIRTEHKRIVGEAKQQARTLLAQSTAEIERTIADIRRMQAEKERTKEVRAHLNEFVQRLTGGENEQEPDLAHLKPKRVRTPRQKPSQKASADANRPLQVGETVVMRGTNTVGTITAIDEKYATVVFGMLTTRVEPSQLERTTRQIRRKAETMSAASQAEIRARQLDFRPDIDVRGMRAADAVQAVTYFIDDAVQFDAKRVRILHGTGTGALREAIRQYLNVAVGVHSYHDEHVQFGGAGITVVDLD